MRENKDQNDSEYGHFLRSDKKSLKAFHFHYGSLKKLKFSKLL